MLKNYLTIAFRTLRRHPGYAFINVAGLAVGIACCLLIVLYIQDELTYDRFHEKGDRIYRLVNSNQEDGQPTNANGSYNVGPAIAKDFPEVEQAVRFVKMGWGEKRVVAHGENRFYEARFYFADPNVFDVFTFPFRAGDARTALTAPNTLVLTEETAQKYFGTADVMGQAIQADFFNTGTFIDYQITGVLENLPANSHIKFDFLISFASLPGPPQGWGWDPAFTYVLLNGNPAHVESRLDPFLVQYMGEDPWYSISLQPLYDIRLRSHLRAELEPNGDIAYVWLFAAIALLILLVACINFMNLATARSAQRAREVGVRKALGAERRQLIQQFLGEALLLSLLAVVLALVLLPVLLPAFNAIADKSMHLDALNRGSLWAALVGLMLVIGLLAGSYPALFLSRFRPVEVLKGKGGTNARHTITLRKGLVVFQFATCVLLFICTAVVYNQMDYIRNTNLGFDRDQVVVLPLNNEVRQRYPALREALLQESGILEMAMSEQVPARAGNGSSYRIEGINDFDWMQSTRLFVSHRFLDTYGIELAAGRTFSEAYATDADEGFIINESLALGLGFETAEAALGKAIEQRFSGTTYSGHIIGVAKDVQLFSMRDPRGDMLFKVQPPDMLNFLSIRLNPAALDRTLAHLESTWRTFAPSYPLDYYFLDDDFAQLHQADTRLGQLFGYFALLAILVACLGLFGLAAFTTEQRTKEIGIRKVLGASVASIVGLLSKDYLKLVGVAFVVAAPLAYFGMQSWLDGFVYRTNVSWWVFVTAGLATVLLAWLTVSYQSVKAATANPIASLRYE